MIAGQFGLQLIERNVEISRNVKGGDEFAFVAEPHGGSLDVHTWRQHAFDPSLRTRIAIDAIDNLVVVFLFSSGFSSLLIRILIFIEIFRVLMPVSLHLRGARLRASLGVNRHTMYVPDKA